MSREPVPSIAALLELVETACDDAGYTVHVDHVSTHRRTVYLTALKPGSKLRLRISDHRNRMFSCGPHVTRRGDVTMLFHVLKHRPGTLAHLLRYLRARSRRTV